MTTITPARRAAIDRDLDAAAQALAASRAAGRKASAAARRAAKKALAAGDPETATAQRLGIERGTLRRWIGK